MTPSSAEIAEPLPGDDVVPHADVVMNRAFTVDAPPEQVWPWLVQLGKQRAGWYLPRWLERVVPRSRRALRHLDARWTELQSGDVIPDYGGSDETFEVVSVETTRHLVYRSQRGRTAVSWAIRLRAVQPTGRPTATRVQLRLRLAPVRHRWLAVTLGEAFDLLTIAGMAAGLRERVAEATNPVDPTG